MARAQRRAHRRRRHLLAAGRACDHRRAHNHPRARSRRPAGRRHPGRAGLYRGDADAAGLARPDSQRIPSDACGRTLRTPRAPFKRSSRPIRPNCAGR
jgi:hypothetical protein